MDWKWTKEHKAASDEIKQEVSDVSLLAHYDSNSPLVLQSDASTHGLGVTLLQHNMPIAYASRPLTSAET
jgi:hypothetical protein